MRRRPPLLSPQITHARDPTHDSVLAGLASAHGRSHPERMHLMGSNAVGVSMCCALQINNKLAMLAAGKLVDDTPIERRSPSPEPVYNEYGSRINTREQRIREKLMNQRTVRCPTQGRGWRGSLGGGGHCARAGWVRRRQRLVVCTHSCPARVGRRAHMGRGGAPYPLDPACDPCLPPCLPPSLLTWAAMTGTHMRA
jgi:hypothetical protein